MKPSYREGDWFALPLKEQRFAIGRIARANSGFLLCFFFGPQLLTEPTIAACEELVATDAAYVTICGDLGLLTRRWRALGHDPAQWDRADWQMPCFCHRMTETLCWRLEYPDSDPGGRPHRTRVPLDQCLACWEDGLAGHEYVELVLTDILSGCRPAKLHRISSALAASEHQNEGVGDSPQEV